MIILIIIFRSTAASGGPAPAPPLRDDLATTDLLAATPSHTLRCANMRACAALSLLVAVGTASAAPAQPWLDRTLPPSQRAAMLIAAMTPKEKLVLLQGASGPGIGNTAAIERLGVPEIHLEDGPNGVADWQVNVTTWPSSMTMAASWDVDLLRQYGAACGAEQRGKGMQVMLGPGVNLARVPVGGRNFEYMGEDPHLASVLAAAETVGIQSEGVVACAKHWVDNNQEGPGHNGRLSTSSVVSDRTNFELYYQPFEAAIKAGVGSAMCSYNLVSSLLCVSSSS